MAKITHTRKFTIDDIFGMVIIDGERQTEESMRKRIYDIISKDNVGSMYAHYNTFLKTKMKDDAAGFGEE